MRMWSIGYPMWLTCAPGLVDYRSHALQIVGLTGDQYFQIIGQTYEAAIKHPMHGTGKSYPIANNIRPVRFDWSYVSRRNFCASHSIDEL